MKIRPIVLLVLLALGCSLPASATNSPIELRTQLKNLLEWLTGEFDSAPQLFFEEEYKTPKELLHGRVYRSFKRVDMPALGQDVLRAEVRYGGKDGSLDASEEYFWILSIDSARSWLPAAS